MNPYPQEGSPSQQRPDPYLSRNAEFNSGLQGGGTGSARSMQQNASTGFQATSVLTPYAQANGQTEGDFKRSLSLNAYRY